MMICKNWRSIVTDDVKLVIDVDTFIFTAASSNTDKIFKVILKSTGEEFFKEKNVEQFETICTNSHVLGAFYNGDEAPKYEKRSTGKYENKRFKNKTEFKGRTKKTISGWLGEHNLEREAEGKEPYSVDDFEFEEELIPNEVHFAYGNFNRKIQEVKDYLGIQDAILLVGVGESHRSNIELPINPNYPEFPERGKYKGMRLSQKPPNLDLVQNYVIDKQGGIAISGIEADDALNGYMYESHLHYKRTGYHKYIGVSIDKDSRSFNSLIFDFTKSGDTWKYPDLLLVDGLGELYLNDKGAVKGDGYLHFMHQMCAGDDCDNYHMSKYMGISFGPKASYNLLKDCKTVKEACEAVVAQYYRIFPDNVVSFKSWSGKTITMTTYEWLNTMFQLVYMLKSRDDKTVFTDVLDSLGVHYKTNPNLDEPNKIDDKQEN